MNSGGKFENLNLTGISNFSGKFEIGAEIQILKFGGKVEKNLNLSGKFKFLAENLKNLNLKFGGKVEKFEFKREI